MRAEDYYYILLVPLRSIVIRVVMTAITTTTPAVVNPDPPASSLVMATCDERTTRSVSSLAVGRLSATPSVRPLAQAAR